MSLRFALTLALALAWTRTATADPIAAAASPPEDVRRSILIGPGGQVWEPDGAGTWTRTTGGGVSADVRGTMLAGELIIAGKATPLYRRDGGAWYGLRLGERGKTLLGAGPRPAVAIGRQIFVRNGDAWKRVGAADRAVVALWAESDRKVLVATERAVLRLAGKKFVVHDPIPVSTFASLAPIGLTADGSARDVSTRTALAPTIDGQVVTGVRIAAGPDRTPWILGRLGTDLVLVRGGKSSWERRPAPPLAADDTVVHLAVDATGAVLVVTADGDVFLAGADGTWTPGRLATALPGTRPGPGPARMP